jgi:hypothetical protein
MRRKFEGERDDFLKVHNTGELVNPKARLACTAGVLHFREM